jgi:signal transduction histidine kinase/DNA-binding response OmpR family regulator
MNSVTISALDKRLDRFLSYQGIEGNALTMKRNIFFGSVTSFFAIAGMTVLGWALNLPTIVNYGFFLLALSIPIILVIIFMKKYTEWFILGAQIINLLTTMYFMLRLGGLLHSAGLMFTGISVLYMSINLQNARITLILFITYLFTLIFTGSMQSGLVPAPELSAWKNLLFFTVNCSWQAGFTLILILTNINQKKKLAEVKQAEAIRLKELDEVKTKLFTNITHEFRTPLTIIHGMADLMKELPEKWLDDGIPKIKKNADRLLHLVNQMLDLSKLEAGAMPLNLQNGDIIAYLRYLVESFSSLAAGEKVILEFIGEDDPLIISFDAEKILQIVSNLISNAIKFTPVGGKVTVKAFRPKDIPESLEIRVSDTGPGIPENLLPNIFDRFYQVESTSGPNAGGTGLGLALVKELTKLIGGTIDAQSPSGSGTTFILKLPVTGTSTSPAHDLPAITVRDILPDYDTPQRKTASFEKTKSVSELPVLLIVEDSADVTDYLKALTANYYQVATACNGREGFEKALAIVPDIILSDVMMPEMDGIAMLDAAKSDFRTSHIPVVMLTAKADIASKLHGLQRGADAYIAKPFNRDELLLQMRNLIELRHRLQQRYSNMGTLSPVEDKSLVIEDKFIMKVRNILELNLDDDQFGIFELCKDLGMSRAQLYRKFKSLTNRTVNEYIRSFRLFKARELLLTSDLNVSEVAFEVGFKNLSHFSRVFTEEFGKNPSELNK